MTGVPSPVEPPAKNLARFDGSGSPVAVAVTDHAVSTSGIRWVRQYRDRLRVTDAMIVAVAMLIAVAVRSAIIGPDILHEAATERIGAPVAIAAAWLLALVAFRTREPHVLGVGALEYKRVLNASATTFGVVAIVFLVAQPPNARWYLVVGAPIGVAGLLAGRWLWRRWLVAERRRGRFLSRAIVVGSRIDAEYVACQIAHDTGAGFVVVGAAIDGDDRSEFIADGTSIPVLDGIGAAAAAAVALHADAVIVTGQYNSAGDAIRQLSWALEGTATELVLSSRLTDVAGPRIHFRPVAGLPLIQVEIPQFDGGKHALKRGFDVFAASMGLIAIAPILITIAIAIKLDGPGPILYRQERIGRDGKTFKLLKFRSMIPGADRVRAELLERNEAAGLLFKLKNDPRVTRTGRFLRQHSLDELPQLWNVLRGEMSMVGPRPPLAEEVDGYSAQVHRRLLIKPGLTGLWQVSGRSDLSWEESVRLDLYYVENWSLTGDLMLIWRTLRVVLRPVGAY
ncbi:sugar transferase [Agromyces cerinus]|uniref:Undecaprenyl-phosphate galactose phosphotransferase, WbaP/exopolysaccharide biosynthesis polyprenyl glycosylphosphotransferase n=1 Tax=Agromyces cerinus subsp. cerinus TaxID=232089 RepID=A0A1N6F6M5_9MICO|nr:sugar transferase [Agromyces cerinus]SIN90958.1 Undecaprenyl-phosphate galactose phosphotransferase, WbaP/exopolysaccharide biosynthesis polyprenyl glycosylphosphotransferase [Agromyces cerinus subsp. cerinus]